MNNNQPSPQTPEIPIPSAEPESPVQPPPEQPLPPTKPEFPVIKET